MYDTDHLTVIGDAIQRIQTPNLQLVKNGTKISMPSPSWMGDANTGGISAPTEELDYLPLDGIDYTNAGIASADVEDKLQALPQRPFRGERIVLSCIKVTALGVAGDALFALIITPAIYVGAVQVGATQGKMPGSAFGATAFGVRLSFPTAGQGTRLYIPFLFPALDAGARLIVTGGIFGRAVR